MTLCSTWGHGEPAGRAVLVAQRRYLDTFVTAVGEYAGLALAQRQARVVERMAGLTDDEQTRFLMELSIEPVHDVLAGRR